MPDGPVRVRLGMLSETLEQALDVAGDVWPTSGMGLGAIFERGTVSLAADGELRPIRGQAAAELLGALDDAREELLAAEAQYAFHRYVVFVLTREADELETTWLTLADQHLRIRAEIVAARREEERLKRALAALGLRTTPLPEHEELPSLGPDRPRKSRGMYANLLDGAAAVVAELDVLPERLAEADHLADERGWATEWGEHARLIVFAHGLALALREREADALDPDDDATVREARQQARERFMGLEGRSATLRFRLFDLRHNNRIVGWRITALRIEERGMRNRLELFEQDRARLEQTLAARRAELGPAAEALSSAEDTDKESSWRTRLSRLFWS